MKNNQHQSALEQMKRKKISVDQKLRKRKLPLKKNKNIIPFYGHKKQQKKWPPLQEKQTPKTSGSKAAPATLTVSGLIIAMLIIPAIIVAPFGNAEQQGAVPTTEESDPSAAVETHADANAPSISVEVMRTASETVENVPLESYVVGVVASEMPANFEPEALKAQALAARTFTANKLIHESTSENYDVTDTVSDQVFKNEAELKQQWGADYTENINKIKEAVQATSGEIITYEGTPINAAFFSTSNGHTENSEDYWENELPYLRSVESPWDEEASPVFLDQQTFTFTQVEDALNIDLPENSSISMETTTTDSGRVGQLELEGNTFSGKEIRTIFGLSSSDFVIEQNNNHLTFTTEGNGHGVGMSQYGANGMAKEGTGYQDIIHHYYTDVDITNISEIEAQPVSNSDS